MLYLSTAYGMVVETLNWLVATEGIVVVVVEVTFPMTDYSQLLDAVTTAVTANADIKLAIFSHISSVVRFVCSQVLSTSMLISCVKNFLFSRL